MRTLPLLAALLLASCTTANIGEGAEDRQTQHLALEVDADTAYTQAMRTAAQYGWRIESSDATARLFTASYEGALSRWGDTVTVMVSEDAVVTVRSTLGQGPNHRHVAGFLERLAGLDN